MSLIQRDFYNKGCPFIGFAGKNYGAGDKLDIPLRNA